jgi:hypothetical protein
LKLVLAGLLVGTVTAAGAQELEPGAYAVAPVGLNVIVVSNTLSIGDLAFDPSGPIHDARGTINVTTVGYGRALSLAGRSAQIVMAVPIVSGHLEGQYLGEFAEVRRFGPGDPRMRVALNVYGAPSMDRKSFAAHRATRLVGASLSVAMPFGQYSSDRLINVGADRWAFKPEIGLVQIVGRWTVETYGGVWLFTKNEEFYRGSVRTQKPIGSAQLHVQYAFRPRLLLSGNANFYSGGRTTVNGHHNLDLQRNSRVGVTIVRPMSRGQTLRVAVSRGAFTTIGADFTSISIAFQRAWGGQTQ